MFNKLKRKAMKKIFYLFVIFALFVMTNIQAQKTSDFIYEEVVTLDSSFTQSLLFVNANEWVAQSFKSANDVIQMADKDAGIIIAKGFFSIPTTMICEGNVYFTVKIQAKDGKYKYTFSDYSHEASITSKGGTGGSLENEKPDCGNLIMIKKGWLRVKENADNTTKEMILSLKESLSKNELAANSEW